MNTGAVSDYAPAWAVPAPGISRPGHEHLFRLELTTVESAAYVARQKARDVLDEWGVSAGHVTTARLLISELVTNAVKFGQLEGMLFPAQISLALWLLRDILVIEVSDQSSDLPVLRPADGESEGGRGLNLVDNMVSRWSYYVPNPGWKTVFCVMDITLSPGPGREPGSSRVDCEG